MSPLSPAEGDALAAALADPRPRRALAAMATFYDAFRADPHGMVPWVRTHRPALEAYVARVDLAAKHRGEVAAFHAHVLLLDLVYRHPDLPAHLATGAPLATPVPDDEVAGVPRLADTGHRLEPGTDGTRWPKAMTDLLAGRAEEAAALLVLLDPGDAGDHRGLALAVRALAEARRGDIAMARRLADAARRTPVSEDVAKDVGLLLGGIDGIDGIEAPAPSPRPMPVAASPRPRPAAPTPVWLSAGRSWPAGPLVALVLAGVLLGLLAFRLAPSGSPSDTRPDPGPPSAEIAALADRIGLTAQGRRIFYAARPALVTASVVRAQCRDVSDRPDDAWAGCYGGENGIAIYAPSDPRLARSTVQTAAHELLHAVFDQLDADERARVTRLLARATDGLAPGNPVRARIDASSRRDERNRPSEQFAYLGTEVMPAGGLAPALEAVYGRYLTDRAALVRNSRRAVKVLEDARDEVVALETRNVRLRVQYEQDRADYAQLRTLYDEYRKKQREVAGDPSQQIEVGWATDGGQPVMRPLAEAVAFLADDLVRRAADLDTRRTDLAKRDARAARLRADAENLIAQATG